MSDNDTFSKRLTRWMEANGYSQADLAAELGMTPATVCLILQDKRKPEDSFAGRFVRVPGPAAAAEVFGATTVTTTE